MELIKWVCEDCGTPLPEAESEYVVCEKCGMRYRILRGYPDNWRYFDNWGQWTYTTKYPIDSGNYSIDSGNCDSSKYNSGTTAVEKV